MEQDPEAFLTLAEATAEAQGQISYDQFWRGIKAGRIKAYQPAGAGGHYRIRRSELTRLLKPVQRSV